MPAPDSSTPPAAPVVPDGGAAAKSQLAWTVLLKQTQSIVTFVYLVTVGVGMLYYHQRYSEFGINIFQYADIFYFLVAPFEDVFILQLCALALALFLFGYWLDKTAERRFPRIYTVMSFGWEKKPWFDTYKSVSWALSLIALIYIYSDVYGESSKKKILEREPVTVSFEDGQTAVGQMIGKTNDTLFLIEQESVKAIPLNASVKEIVITSIKLPAEDTAE